MILKYSWLPLRNDLWGNSHHHMTGRKKGWIPAVCLVIRCNSKRLFILTVNCHLQVSTKSWSLDTSLGLSHQSFNNTKYIQTNKKMHAYFVTSSVDNRQHGVCRVLISGGWMRNWTLIPGNLYHGIAYCPILSMIQIMC